MAKLGLDESFTTAVSLLEWAERLEGLTPTERLDVYISTGGNRGGIGRVELLHTTLSVHRSCTNHVYTEIIM